MMKKTFAVFLAALTALCCAVPALAASVYESYRIPTGSMRMIAHRGYSSVAPENTLPAYRAAGESGFWGAECDIQRTADGVWVLMHDATVDRMTDGEGAVSELTYAEISALTVDEGSNIARYPGTKVPTLEEYLDVCREYGLHPVIEIKNDAAPEDMESLAALLSAREEKDMFVVISFGRTLCVRIKKLMPETPVYYLVSKNATQEDIDFAARNGLDGMDIHCALSEDYVKAIRAAGLDVIVWTVDDLATAAAFHGYGVAAVTTNTLTGSAPEGNLFQRFIWKLRDLWYRLVQTLRQPLGASRA